MRPGPVALIFLLCTTASLAPAADGLPSREQARLEGVATELQRVVEKAPADGAAWLRLGRAHARLGRHEQAFAAFGRAASVDPDNPEPRAQLAILRALRGDAAGAALDLMRLGQSFPTSAVVPAALAKAAAAAGDLAGADAALDSAHRLAPDDPEITLAWLKGRRGLPPQEREQAARRLVERLPDSYEARYLLAEMLAAGPKPDEALSFAADVVTAHPDWVPGRLLLARAYARMGDILAAAAEIEQVPQERLPAEGLVLLAKARMRTLRTEDARRLLETAIQRDPTLTPAQHELARLYTRLRMDTGAQQLLDALLKRDPLDYDALVIMSEMLQASGHYDRSMAYVDRAVQANAARPEAYRSRGTLAIKRGHHEEAVRHLREALARQDKHVGTYLLVAQAYYGMANYTAAAENLRTAVRLAPARPEPHYQLGQVLLRLGQVEQARKEIKLAERLASFRRGTLPGGLSAPVLIDE